MSGQAPRLLSAKKAAESTGLPYTTLRDLVFKGEIAVIKFGRRWFFERGDLDRLIESHKERRS